MKDFVHLHLHSQFSLLDSAIKIPDLIKKAAECNMSSLALTDHGNILGAIGFFKEARKNNIKPIIGAELYMAAESRFSRPDKKKGEINYYHLLALVKNQAGYRNLSELITLSFIEGFYRKPRIDKEILAKYHEGLVISSACIQGEIARHFLNGRDDKAFEAARWYRDLFKEDYYIEIQNHQLPQQLEVLPKLINLAKELSIPVIATNDIHYLTREDADSREILICLQTNHVLSNTDRPMKKETEDMYFKSGAEMLETFASIPECITQTREVAEKCNFEFKLGKYFLPEFKTPDQYSIDDYFEFVCRQGFENIRPLLLTRKTPIAVYEDRLTYEIQKIKEMGFPGYFLIVWDIIKYAKDCQIPVGPGRGSVVGSLVAYAMKITTVDPMEYDLIFERFLNPERVSMPDIDIDFDGERRREVIEYIRQKYGADSVCQIVTFGKMKAKMAIRDIGRVLEIPLAYVNKLAKMIPEGPKVDLQEEINSNKELQHEIKQQPETKKLFQLAQKLEGTVRNTSMHAAGVVIAPKKLTEFMPLYKAKDDIVTQFEKDEVEEVGLLKMDILGLKTLTILKNILKEIKDVEGLDLDLDQIPINDPKTFQVFQSGDTDGIFQFESSGMRDYLKRSKPDKIEDLIVLNALYRPGPLGSGMADSYVNRKIGKEAVTYLFPEIQDILKDTYGIIVFQEQVMQISVVVAGFSMSKADEMRKIMGKKQVNKLPAIEKQFTAGAKDRNFDTKKANELFSQMKTFAEYGFNKSHSTAYAFLAYQTAYLKAHYPVYFMAANLSNEAEKTSSASQVIQYISEIKKMGIQLLPPDINHSFEYFKVETASAIRFGLKGLKNVGDAAIQAIISSRNENGPFKDYADFISRIDLTKVNKAVLESLIKAGLFDKFGIKRRALFLSVEAVIKQAAVLEKKKQDLQMSLFGNDNIMSKVTIPKDLQDEPEWSETEIIKGEREITGIYISHNPLENYQEEIKKVSNTQIANLSSFKNGKVKIAGIVTDFKQIKSKKGDFYGDIYFEDFSGRVKVLAFKDRWEKVKDTITVDKLYFLEGRIPEQAESDPNIYLENLIDLDAHLLSSARKIIVKIDHTLLNQDFNLQLAEKIKANQDSVPYVIVIRQNGYRAIIASTDDHAGLKPTTEMKTAIESLTGANTVEILYS